MYVDYLRGRCVKTTVEIGSDGKVLLETVNRGKAALKWIARLQGKKLLQAVPDEPRAVTSRRWMAGPNELLR